MVSSLRKLQLFPGKTIHRERPVDGKDRCAGLQPVESVGAAGGIGRPYLAGDEPAAADLWSCHGKAEAIAKLLEYGNRILLRCAAAAKPLNRKQRWARMIRTILREVFPKRAREPAP